MFQRREVLLALTATLFGARFAAAETAEETREWILSVNGKTSNGRTFRFTRDDLLRLGAKRISTHTPWHDGVVAFDGVPAHDLMTLVGATGETARIFALDDYQVDVPLMDFTRYGAIFAYAMNGRALTVEEKGPLFLVYPYDSEPQLASETYYARSIWQIAQITIL
jgi:hypothetical protein